MVLNARVLHVAAAAGVAVEVGAVDGAGNPQLAILVHLGERRIQVVQRERGRDPSALVSRSLWGGGPPRQGSDEGQGNRIGSKGQLPAEFRAEEEENATLPASAASGASGTAEAAAQYRINNNAIALLVDYTISRLYY